MSTEIGGIVAEVSRDRLNENVRALEGLRHGTENYAILEEKAGFIEDELRSFGLAVESQPVIYRQRRYRNIIATLRGNGSGKEKLLVGAHYDSPRGSPGADDNASGVAVLLEAARIQMACVEPPPPLENSPKCFGCSLAGICLPDEVECLNRQDAANPLDVRRLYPARDDALPLYVQDQGARVGKEGQALVVSRGFFKSRVSLRSLSR